MKSILLLLLFILSFSQLAQARIFKIKEGKHSSSGVHVGLFIAKEMTFKAKFDDSAEYYLGNVNQLDINKLYGFSDCYSKHHRNSARFGWNWNDRTLKVDIYAYSYSRSLRKSSFLTSIDINRFYNYKIKVHKHSYEFIINNRSVHHPRNCSQKKAHGYKLYPYFGGDEVAPHDIEIEIR